MVDIGVIARRFVTGLLSPSIVEPELGIVEGLLEDYRLGNKSFAGIILPPKSDLSGKILIRINLSYAYLHGTNFTDTNLTWADLERARFKGANLTGVDFKYANLEGANFEYANLAKADFRYTNLRRADLRRSVNLGQALGLGQASLSDTIVTEAERNILQKTRRAMGGLYDVRE